MTNEYEPIEERLWDYIDGQCSPDQRSAIDELIRSNLEWKRKYQELLQVHEMMNSATLDEPSMRFAKNVMEEIAKLHIAPATKSYINKKIIWGIGGFFITMIIGFVVFAFFQVNWTNGSNAPDILSKYSSTAVSWSRFFGNTYTNIFMGANIVLGLIFLDMYLQRKKSQTKHLGS
jgi:hypothetical protein